MKQQMVQGAVPNITPSASELPAVAMAIISSNAFSRYKPLTQRERAVLAQVMIGARSNEIGRMLGISPRTVEFHRANIIEKFEAKNTADLVRIALSRRYDR
jgi:two-component system, LuxR family, response regulator FixJ